MGIAFSKNGTWTVADVTNNCVWVFDSKDRLIGKFGSGLAMESSVAHME